MKVTSDRIRARALQLRKEGLKLSGNTVRRTLELNAGARTQLSSTEQQATVAWATPEHAADGAKKIKAGWRREQSNGILTLLTEAHRKTMPRNERTQNGRSTVR